MILHRNIQYAARVRGPSIRGERRRTVTALLFATVIAGASAKERVASASQPGSDYPYGIGLFTVQGSSNTWFFRNELSQGSYDVALVYGGGTDKPVVGDWDGTGADTIGVFRTNAIWALRNKVADGAGDITFSYGLPGDTPITGDWDGDGVTTIGVWRQGQWLLRNSNSAGSPDITFTYGNATDVPIVGDWDGNGTTTVGVVRNGNRWLLKNTNSGGAADISFTYGSATGEIPVVGDWDGNGTSTPGVVHGTTWFLRNSNTDGDANITFSFTNTTGIPITGNWRRSWRPLINQPTFSPDTALLLTDGTVIVHVDGSSAWWRLTPDQYGSYGMGTWTQIRALESGYSPRYFASAVLADGRVIVEGGEDNAGSNGVDTTLGEIYDPTNNMWTPVSPPSGWAKIGDAPSTVLANGLFMLGNCCSTQQALLNPLVGWTATGTGKADSNNEEGGTLLPNTELLVADVGVEPASEIYDPFRQSWSFAGDLPASLVDSVNEIGPQLLMNNGSVFVCGASTSSTAPPSVAAHTAVYSASGTWLAGPDVPSTTDGFVDCADSPAALVPNGNALIATGPGYDRRGVHFFEFDGSKLTEMPRTPQAPNVTSFQERFRLLPTGQVFVTDNSLDAELYQTSGVPSASWAPAITSVPTSLARGSTYTASGTQFNGLSQAVAYGDDAQMATNYPLVRITNNATHHVFYARTHGHSSMGVATGSQQVSTSFDVPANADTGASKLAVVANGIASSTVSVTVQ